MRLLAMCVVVAGLASGCASPSVTYRLIKPGESPPASFVDSYYLQQSRIVIKPSGKMATNDEGLEAPEYSIESIPSEHRDVKIVISSDSSWGVKTNISISKVENSDMVKEIGVEVSDKRVDLIEKVGKGVVGLISVAGFGAGEAVGSWPIVFNVSQALAAFDTTKKTVVPKTGVSVTFDDLPPDARPLTNISAKEVAGGFIYSACRTATVSWKATASKKVKDAAGKETTQTSSYLFERSVKVSDPRYFQYVAFPAKGKITTHSQCGVSVTTEKDDGRSTTVELINAVIKQGQDIKDSLKKDAGDGK